MRIVTETIESTTGRTGQINGDTVPSDIGAVAETCQFTPKSRDRQKELPVPAPTESEASQLELDQ